MVRITLFIFALAGLGLTGVVSMTRHQPAQPPMVAFQSFRDGNWEIYSTYADGSHVRRLTHSPASDTYPTWSPDGRWIIYVSGFGGDLFKMPSGGGQPQQLTGEDMIASYPAWSPDGEQVAFVARNLQTPDWFVYTMRPDGSEIRRITERDVYTDFPSWSPDGKWLAFTAMAEGNRELFKIRVDGNQETRLTYSRSTDWGPRWMPDGAWISFTTDIRRNYDVFKIPAEGGEWQGIVHTGWDESLGAWGGDWLVFASWQSGDLELYRLHTRTGEELRLTYSRGADWVPAVSPPISLPWRGWAVVLAGVAMGSIPMLKPADRWRAFVQRSVPK